MSTSCDDGGDDDGRQRRLGKILEQPGEKQQRHDGQGRGEHSRDLAARAGGRVDRGLGQAAADHHAAAQAGGEVGATEGDQLAVGVDPPAADGGERLRCPQSLCERDQHHADPARGQPAGVRESDVRQAQRRQAAADRPDGRHIEPERLDRGDRSRDSDQRAGNGRSNTPQSDDQRQRDRADEQREPLRISQMGDQLPRLLEEVAAPPADPEHLRQLADDDRERQSDDEALEHGLADEVGQEAETQHTREQRGDAGGQRQPRRERGEAAAAGATMSATVAADKAAVAAIGPTTSTLELPSAA